MDKELFLGVFEHLRESVLSELELYKGKNDGKDYSYFVTREEAKLDMLDLVLDMTKEGKFDKYGFNEVKGELVHEKE